MPEPTVTGSDDRTRGAPDGTGNGVSVSDFALASSGWQLGERGRGDSCQGHSPHSALLAPLRMQLPPTPFQGSYMPSSACVWPPAAVFLRVASLKHLTPIHCPCCTRIDCDVPSRLAPRARIVPLDIRVGRRILSKSEVQ